MKNIMQKWGFGFWLGLVSVIAMGLIIWGMVYMAGRETKKYRESTSREVAMMCTTDMATQFHIHPNLKIIINGSDYDIPGNIGITETCMNSIHSHDGSGQLHVEAPVQKDFTLADFFAVWDKPFNETQILDYKTDAQHKIIFTVNGQPSTDYENLLLKDLDNIVIEYKAF